MSRDEDLIQPDPRILVADDLWLHIENGLWTVWIDGPGNRSKRLIDVGFPTSIEAEKFAQGYELGRQHARML